MSVSITGPALSSLLFEHCNSDGDREGFLLGNVTSVVTNTISDADISVVQHQTVYNVYSFRPLYSTHHWCDRKGAVDKNAVKDILQDVNLTEVIGWYKLRRNSSMQVSMRERVIHRNLSRWLQRDEDSSNLLFMLCLSQSASNPLYTCDHLYMIENNMGGYDCLPETIVSLAGVAQPSYKLSAVCVSSEECTYNRVLNKTRHGFVDTHGEPKVVCEISKLSVRLGQKLKSLSDSILDSEEHIAKELTELRELRLQLKECRGQASDGRDMMVSSNASTPCDEKPLIEVPSDDSSASTTCAPDKETLLLDGSSEDVRYSQSQLLPGSNEAFEDSPMLLDTEDEASSLQIPCLIPQSVASSVSSASTSDGEVLSSVSTAVVDTSVGTVPPALPNGSMQEHVERQNFDFVNDMMRSSSPNPSHKSASLPRHSAKGSERNAAEFERLKSQGAQRPSSKTGLSADSTGTKSTGTFVNRSDDV